jgi:hypothetical protein
VNEEEEEQGGMEKGEAAKSRAEEHDDGVDIYMNI